MTLDRTLTILGWLVLFSPHITCVVLWIGLPHQRRLAVIECRRC
jgi:hypothetical protein